MVTRSDSILHPANMQSAALAHGYCSHTNTFMDSHNRTHTRQARTDGRKEDSHNGEEQLDSQHSAQP